MNSNSFWDQVSAHAASVVNCPFCLNRAQKSSGLPQPGFVGPDYKPGAGLAFILQNPSVAGENSDSAYQASLSAFAQRPTVTSYQSFVKQAIDDARTWRMFNTRVGKIIQGCFEIEEIAWLNVVKHRTPRNETPSNVEFEHGASVHLRHELKLLDPAAIVTIYEPATTAVTGIGYSTLPLHGRVASNDQISKLRADLNKIVSR